MRVELASAAASEPYANRAQSILRKCVHCGFCNTTCPTYNLLGEELDGPRGRIYLIKGMLESDGTTDEYESTRTHLDRCLTCRNCETTCPSGVEYGELLEIGRDILAEQPHQTSLLERLLLFIVPRHKLLRQLVRLGGLFKFLLPRQLRKKVPLLKMSKSVPSSETAEVTLIQGCAQRALTPDVNQHIAKLLTDRGIEVRLVEDEYCCGGMHLHLGQSQTAQRIMQDNCERLYSESSSVYLSSASGCGVTIKDYDRLLDTTESKVVADRTQDLCEYLKDMSFEKHANIKRVAIHNPCSLQHGQGIRGIIEEILSKTGYELVPVSEPHLCCGSAGTYSFLQPELADQLKQRKLAHLEANSPDVIATANVGCELHLGSGSNTPVVHWVTLLN